MCMGRGGGGGTARKRLSDGNDSQRSFHDSGMNFSANADPEPELLLTILRHISLIEHKTESRRQGH